MIYLSAFADEAAKSLKGQIEALNRNGIKYSEIRSVDGVNVAKFTIETAKEYQKEMADNGVAVWSIGSPLGKVSINVDFNEYEGTVRHVCELANVFNADKIRMFSFFDALGEKNKVFDYLGKMIEIGKEYKVSEVQSSDDSGEFESYIDAYIFAKEMSGNISLEKYKEIKSDEYVYSHLMDSDTTELEKDLNNYSKKKRGENRK